MADTLTNPMHVEVISPDGAIYQDDGVDMVVARAQAAKKRAEERLASRAEDIDVDRARLALMRALIRLSATKSL